MGGLPRMPLTDTRGAISLAVFPLFTVPSLRTMEVANFGGIGLLVTYSFLNLLRKGEHVGKPGIAGMADPGWFPSDRAGQLP